MALTKAQLRTVIQKGIADRSDFSVSEIDSYLNIAQERIARQRNWRELQNTTDLTLSFTGVKATDKIVDISSLTNLRDIKDVVIEDSSLSRKLTKKTPEEFDKFIALPEYFAADHPLVYTCWGDKELIIYPVTNAAYTARIRWYNWPASFSTDASTSELLRKDDMLIFLTLSFIFALLREEEQANRYFSYYKNELENALEENDRMPDLRISPNFTGPGRPQLEYWRQPFDFNTGVGAF